MFFIFLNSKDFLDSFEVGQQLYKNPRGVSCIKCHGKKGNGKIIVKSYYENRRKKTLRTYSINNISFKRFKKAFSENREKDMRFMPKYFLTNKEIKDIYNFLKEINYGQ